MSDYYTTLGVSVNATDEEIKTAFRKLVKIYHPDVSKAPGSHEKYIEIQEAYETLSCPDKRRDYDNKLKNDKNNSDNASNRDKRAEYNQSHNNQQRSGYDSTRTHKSSYHKSENHQPYINEKGTIDTAIGFITNPLESFKNQKYNHDSGFGYYLMMVILYSAALIVINFFFIDMDFSYFLSYYSKRFLGFFIGGCIIASWLHIWVKIFGGKKKP